jgi:hypothetical protein
MCYFISNYVLLWKEQYFFFSIFESFSISLPCKIEATRNSITLIIHGVLCQMEVWPTTEFKKKHVD